MLEDDLVERLDAALRAEKKRRMSLLRSVRTRALACALGAPRALGWIAWFRALRYLERMRQLLEKRMGCSFVEQLQTALANQDEADRELLTAARDHQRVPCPTPAGPFPPQPAGTLHPCSPGGG